MIGGQVRNAADVQLGYEVQVEGPRLHDGTVLARRFEAKPNDGQMFETQVVFAAHRIEREWLQADRVELRDAHEAGFDVTAGPLLWARFQQRFGQLDEATNFVFATHSRPSDRIANIEHEIQINYRDSELR